MTIQQLQYVIALDLHRHFVRAAQSCEVAQPTLTLQVKKLETEVGFKIFDRSTKPIQSTPMGAQFIEKARQIIREVDSLKELVNQDKNQLKGTFKLGVIPTLAPYLLPVFLKDFIDLHEGLSLEVKEMQSERIMEELDSGTLDIGIMATPLAHRNLREIPMFYEPFLIYAHANHGILKKQMATSEDMQQNGLWVLDQGHCFRNQVLNICGKKEGRAVERISFDSGSIETLKNMIKGHSGFTLVPELSVKPEDKALVRRFETPEPAREVSLVVHHTFTKELLLKHLRKSIQSSIPTEFKKNNRFVTVQWR